MNIAFRAYQRMNDMIVRFVQFFAILIVAFAVFSVFGGAVERYFIGHGYAWLNDLPPLLIPWAVFPMMAVLIRDNLHVTVDVLPEFLKEKGKRRLQFYVNLIVLISALVFFWGSMTAMDFFLKMGTVASVDFYLPMWWIYASFPIGFVLLANFAIEGILKILLREDGLSNEWHGGTQ